VGAKEGESAFLCGGGCGKKWHWLCVGYDQQQLSSLPIVVCPQCLSSQGLADTACELAVMQRQLLEEHVARLGHQIVPIAADGLCLLRSVATAAAVGINDLFEAALLHIVASLEIIQSDEERDCVAATCNTLLEKKTRRQLNRLWDSPLYDYLPKALASVTGRPLHIHEAVEGEIKLHVFAPDELKSSSPSIMLRSYGGIRFDHYDLCVQR
jgi:hypothetical protein